MLSIEQSAERERRGRGGGGERERERERACALLYATLYACLGARPWFRPARLFKLHNLHAHNYASRTGGGDAIIIAGLIGEATDVCVCVSAIG